jgi:putative endonuclease
VVLAAQHYLLHLRSLPPCRFDVIEVTPEGCHWLRAAFEAA